MLRRSPRGSSLRSMAATCFSTASDSPVSAASWMRRLTLSSRRRSAGTRLPASSRRMSPGTSSLAGSSWMRPSRRTRTAGTANFFRAAMARSARYSWRKPSRANKSTIARIAAASCHFCRNAEITAAASRISTMVAVNCSHKMRQGVRPPRSTSSFGPYCRSRSAASAALNPCVTSVLRSRATCSARSRCHCAIVSSSFPKAGKQKGEAIAFWSMVSPSEVTSARQPGPRGPS